MKFVEKFGFYHDDCRENFKDSIMMFVRNLNGIESSLTRNTKVELSLTNRNQIQMRHLNQ